MDFALRPLTAADIPALQRVYDVCSSAFERRLGRIAAPDQAASDYGQAQTTPGRFQFGTQLDGEMIGLVDCKLDDNREGVAHLGLVLLTPPYDDPEIASLSLRVLTTWLAGSFAVHRLETDVLAHDPEVIRFWTGEGFTFTGEQYRRELPDYAPRLLVMAKDLLPPQVTP
jgi:RimJ/RimL family protein N-acetyltransferase